MIRRIMEGGFSSPPLPSTIPENKESEQSTSIVLRLLVWSQLEAVS